MTDISPTGEIHPVAALFPMMSDEELDDLAADIKENGLVQPIVLDDEGTLIDGRNRMEGCRRAGVQPTFTTINGQDPVAFILSSNVARRHLSKGQQAMAVAKTRLVSNRSAAAAAETVGVSKARVVQASTVLNYAPDVADSVLTGATSLDSAYEIARRRKDAASSVEDKMARLRQIAPDLVDAVVEERLDLDRALAEGESRIQRERERRARHTRQFAGALVSLYDFAQEPALDFADGTYEPGANDMRPDPEIYTARGLRAISRWLNDLAKLVDSKEVSL